MDIPKKSFTVKPLRKDIPTLCFSYRVFCKIIATIGRFPAETGGVLGGKENNSVVTSFYFDKTSHNSVVTYSPDCNTINNLFDLHWNPRDIRFRGFIHSHPSRMNQPSPGDVVYAKRILMANEDLEYLWLPIISSIQDTGEFKLSPWVYYPAENSVNAVKTKIKIVTELSQEEWEKNIFSLPFNTTLDEINFDRSIIAKTKKEHWNIPTENSSAVFDTNNTFDRVKKAYDLDVMHKSRIIGVGCGGSASWLEELARAGLGQFILIDPDVVSETNLATQQTYRHDIGRPKVDCIAERIFNINPKAKIITYKKKLEDICDKEFEHIAKGTIDGMQCQQTILGGFTDNFYAQAHVNRRALHFGIPSLCAQVYKEGRGAEITFTYPCITPACHHCILRSRYDHYLNKSYKNDVTSHGTPIFATTRLNAIKGFIILAMLHHGTDHPRWGKILRQIGKRNLIQVRMVSRAKNQISPICLIFWVRFFIKSLKN